MEASTVHVSSSAMERLVADALSHLEGLGYQAATVSIYRGVWKALIRFSRTAVKQNCLLEDLCSRFLMAHEVPVDDDVGALPSRKRQFRAAVRVLVEFAEDGCVRHRRRRRKTAPLSPVFRQALNDYLSFSRDYLNHGRRTLRLRAGDLTEFLHFVDSHGIESLTAISGPRVREFVCSRNHLASATLKHYVAALRSFVRYLWANELIGEDLSAHIPVIPHYRYDRIPSVWTNAEVETLLGAVDRGSPKGKRDYAILLLACRLGMRVGDIRQLRLEHLLWDEARIEVIQAKTAQPLSLPMSDEIGRALIDYLRHGRPSSDQRYVFLRLLAPFEPFGANNNLQHIVNQYRRRAGIELPDRCRRGMHSLRHTLASRLLERQTPIETIANILGHRTIESTRVYTKVDINALRTAALDPQEVCDA